MGRGDPLDDMIAATVDGQVERMAKGLSGALRTAGAAAVRRRQPKLAKFLQLLAGDVLRRLREVNS